MKIKTENRIDVHIRLITTYSEFDVTEEMVREFENKVRGELYRMVDEFRRVDKTGTASVRAVFAGVSDANKEWT